MPCWNGFCITRDCDGLHHTDSSGFIWDESKESNLIISARENVTPLTQSANVRMQAWDAEHPEDIINPHSKVLPLIMVERDFSVYIRCGLCSNPRDTEFRFVSDSHITNGRIIDTLINHVLREH